MIPSMMQILESQASDEAEKLHLDYMGFGRWGTNGIVTHRTDDGGKLVPVKKPVSPGAGAPAASTTQRPSPTPQASQAPQTPQASPNIKVGNIEIGADKRSVTIKGAPVQLSGTEYRLLKMLATQKGQITTRSDLLQQVWDAAPDIVTRTVDMYVSRLKRKLIQSGASIKSVRGMGYRMLDLPMSESLTEGPSMKELTPEIQTKLLERAKKNIQWYKKLESVLSTLDAADPKKSKVEKVRDVLKVQALLIIKSLKELDTSSMGEDGLKTNASPIETLRRNPTRNNMPGNTPGADGLSGA